MKPGVSCFLIGWMLFQRIIFHYFFEPGPFDQWNRSKVQRPRRTLDLWTNPLFRANRNGITGTGMKKIKFAPANECAGMGLGWIRISNTAFRNFFSSTFFSESFDRRMHRHPTSYWMRFNKEYLFRHHIEVVGIHSSNQIGCQDGHNQGALNQNFRNSASGIRNF